MSSPNSTTSKKTFRAWLITGDPPPSPQVTQLAFWQQMFIYFWCFAVLGHWIELIWSPISAWLSYSEPFVPLTYLYSPISIPYGLGAVGIILVILPLVRKHRLHPLGAFFLSLIVTAAVEYISATLIVWLLGSNPFWDYSHKPFNLQGRIDLINCCLFGFISMIFLYYIYPWWEKIISKIPPKVFQLIFWVLFLTLTADLVFLVIRFIMSQPIALRFY